LLPFSSFGDATQGLPPGRRTLWDGFVADSNGIDGIGVVATEGSRVLLEITSNRLAGSSNAHAGLNTNGDTTISNNGNDGVGIVTTGGTSDILITSGTGQTTLSGNGTQGGGNGIRWDASGNSDGTVRADSLIITGSIAGASETVANLNNGILDPGEDINGNGILDQGEDTDNNQDLDTENGDGIQANFADNSVATLQIGGVGAGNIIQNNEDDGIAITATGTGALLSSTAAGESVPRPIISMQENLVGGEDNGVAAGNGGDGFSLNVLGDIASNAQLLSDPANVDTDLAGGLFGNTDGVQQSGPIVQISADNNQFTRNGRIGVNLRLNGAAGERDRENGNSTFDPVRLTFTNNTISSNTLEGVYLGADSDMNQGRFTYLPNFPFPNPPFNPADQRPQEYRNSAAISDELVVVSSQFKQVDAIDIETGKRKWRHTLRRRADASPIIAGDDVWIAATDGRLVRLSADDGTEKWTYEIRGAFLAAPAIAGDRLFIADDDGVIRCFGDPAAQRGGQ